MQKLKMRSLDLVCDNVARIRELFPHCVTEAHDAGGEVTLKVDFDLLRQELSDELVEGPQERYRLDWPGKREAYAAANAPIAKSLRPCREESVDFDATENLYIEGDNLEVLKLLQESYLGKVKMIYIDPPYNTGNDFIYKDNFTEDAREFLHRNGQYDDDGNRMKQNLESDGRFHSNWLSMIYPRLRIARNLLADDGLILLNIDENEITNMQKICELIFGEPNDLGTIVWDKRNPKGDSRGVSYQHECIIVFSRNKETLLANCKMLRPKKNAELMLKKAEQLFKKIDSNFTLKEINKEFQAWITMQKDFSSGEAAYKFIDNNGDVYRPVSMAWPNNKKAPDDYFIPLIHPTTHKACPVPQKGWRNPSVTMRKLQESGLIIFGKDESIQPNRKYLLKENMDENISSLLYYGGSDTDMLAEMEVPFDTPKVVAIVKEHINSFTKPDDIILDFFSGSATTAHAVMQLNAEDGGKRKFIMVQLPEVCAEGTEAAKAGYKNICEIGKERIRRAGERIVSSEQFSVFREEMMRYGCVKLSRSDCLAEGDEFNGGSLQAGEEIAERGTLYAVRSDEESSDIDSIEYSRGTGQELKKGIRQLSFDSKRIEGGTGDTTANLRQSGLPCRFGYFGSGTVITGNRQNAEQPHFKTENCQLTTENYRKLHVKGGDKKIWLRQVIKI